MHHTAPELRARSGVFGLTVIWRYAIIFPMKTALVTGASSGIGKEISICLAKRGYNIILVARREDRLSEIASYISRKYKVMTRCEVCDVSDSKACFSLYEKTRSFGIDILVNGAGFGLLSDFSNASLDREMAMIDTNIRAVHILTKLFLQDMENREGTYILNIASSAGLCPAGPYMSTYYATKSYVTSLTSGIAAELKAAGSPTYIGALCPGPVDTEFNEISGGTFTVKPLSAKACAKAAVKGMFARKEIIVPGLTMKLAGFFQGFLPRNMRIDMVSKIQQDKMKSQ